jgi:hypothetical protein
MRNKRKNLQHFGEALSGSNRGGLTRKLRRYEPWRCWTDIVGPSLAQHTSPAGWRGATLVINVEHSAWMQELQFMKRDLIAKINETCPNTKLKDIRFQIGKIEGSVQQDTAGNTHTLPALGESEKDFARDTARPVTDDETRETIRRLIEKDLSLKKNKRLKSKG